MRHHRVEFLVKVDSMGTIGPHLAAVAPGSRIDFEGPSGAFTLGAAPAPAYLFVAGGTGISPLRAMLRHLIATDAGATLSMLYSARVPEELAFRDELERLARRNLIQLHFTVTGQPTATWDGIARPHLDRGPGAGAAVQGDGVLSVRTARDGRGRAAAAAAPRRALEPGADGRMVNAGPATLPPARSRSHGGARRGHRLLRLAHRAALGRVRRARRCRSRSCRRRSSAAPSCSSATCTSGRASTTTTSPASSTASATWRPTSSSSPATSPRTIAA